MILVNRCGAYGGYKGNPWQEIRNESSSYNSLYSILVNTCIILIGSSERGS